MHNLPQTILVRTSLEGVDMWLNTIFGVRTRKKWCGSGQLDPMNRRKCKSRKPPSTGRRRGSVCSRMRCLIGGGLGGANETGLQLECRLRFLVATGLRIQQDGLHARWLTRIPSRIVDGHRWPNLNLMHLTVPR